jgi:hypothetical protein
LTPRRSERVAVNALHLHRYILRNPATVCHSERSEDSPSPANTLLGFLAALGMTEIRIYFLDTKKIS